MIPPFSDNVTCIVKILSVFMRANKLCSLRILFLQIYSTLKIYDLPPGIYRRQILHLDRIDNWFAICDLSTHLFIFHAGHILDALSFLQFKIFMRGLDREVNLGFEIPHKSPCSSLRLVCLQLHSFSDLILPTIPSLEEITHFVLLYFSLQHEVRSFPTCHTSIPLCGNCRNVRLGEILSH